MSVRAGQNLGGISRRQATWSLALFIGVALLVYLAGGGRVSLWDRDEAWYAQTSKQMVESGDWTLPRFLDQPRYAKPILIYWLQALSMKALGATEQAARLPSAIAATLTLIILGLTLRKWAGPRMALLTVMIFGSSAMIVASAKMCLTDSVLLVFVNGAQLCLMRIYCQARRGTPDGGLKPTLQPTLRPALLWLCIALAVLTKGPYVLAILLATTLVLAILDRGKAPLRWWRETRPFPWVLLIPAAVAPWLIAACLKDPGFVMKMLQEPFKHFGSNEDGHWPWPGYYLISTWLTWFPWCLFLPVTLIISWKHRRLPHVRFALATIIGNWIFSELMTTKLPHYMMPSHAALAFLTARALVQLQRGRHWRLLLLQAVMALLWAALAGGLIWLARIPPIDANPLLGKPGDVFALLGGAYVLLTLGLLLRRRVESLVPTMAAGMLVLVAFLYLLYFPSLSAARLPARIAEDLRARGATAAGHVVMIGYTEPSLAFYQGGTIRARKLDELRDSPPWIVVRRDVFDSAEFAPRRPDYAVVATHHGYSYNVPVGPTEVMILRRR